MIFMSLPQSEEWHTVLPLSVCTYIFLYLHTYTITLCSTVCVSVTLPTVFTIQFRCALNMCIKGTEF